MAKATLPGSESFDVQWSSVPRLGRWYAVSLMLPRSTRFTSSWHS